MLKADRMADPFRKYHGLGNDYIVIDPSVVGFEPTPAAVRAVCDRNYGAGSDGILFGPLGADSAVDLRIFNPDGSEAEKSGNGLRIFAWYLFERGLLPPAGSRIRTMGGPVFVRVADAARRVITVDMGEPAILEVDRELVVGSATLRGTFVSMGNPHCVVLHARSRRRHGQGTRAADRGRSAVPPPHQRTVPRATITVAHTHRDMGAGSGLHAGIGQQFVRGGRRREEARPRRRRGDRRDARAVNSSSNSGETTPG